LEANTGKFTEYDNKIKELKMALFRDTTQNKKSFEDLRSKYIESIANVGDQEHADMIKEKRIKNIEEAFIV